MTNMFNVFSWGMLATFSLVLGGIVALLATPSKRVLGVVMAFGAGTLISAVAYELVFEAVKLAKGTGYPGMGFVLGALIFFSSEKLLEMTGGKGRKEISPSQQTQLLIPMVLAIILDGVPESLVIGLGIKETGTVSLAMLVAVFISNLPEAIAGTTGMKSSGWSWKKIISLWLLISIVCAFATLAGFSLLGNTSNTWISFINAFAGGAILMMLSNTMIPEAYEHGGKLAGIFTVLGFGVSIFIILLEHTH